jgi:hypothetical protein
MELDLGRPVNDDFERELSGLIIQQSIQSAVESANTDYGLADAEVDDVAFWGEGSQGELT